MNNIIKKSVAFCCLSMLILCFFAGCKNNKEQLTGMYIEQNNTSNFEFFDGNKFTLTTATQTIRGTYEIKEKTITFEFKLDDKKKMVSSDISDKTQFRFTLGQNKDDENRLYISQ